MWLSIVISVIQRGSVRLPLHFALTLVYKARNRPTGHTENQEGSCICFNPVCKQLSADLRQRSGSGNEFCPCEGKQGVLRADLYPECSLWHVCHSHHFLSQEKKQHPQVSPTVRHIPHTAATTVALLPYTLLRPGNKGE